MLRILAMPNEGNMAVTEYYINIIRQAGLKAGFEVSNFKKGDKISKHDVIFVVTVKDALYFWIRGYKNIIIWIQGIQPEESLLKNNSKFRYMVLSLIEKFILKKSLFIFLVSNSMKEHFLNKYNLDLSKRSYIMPCYNSELDLNSFDHEDKYKNNIFAYVGSLAVWQCFDETLELYKKVEEKVSDSFLRVYTSSINEATQKINKVGIKRFSIKYVDSSKLLDELRSVKFGFIIRADNIVNKVATPTKISTYLSAGIIPIYSKTLSSFHDITENVRYKIPMSNDDTDLSKILQFCEKEINSTKLRNEYKQIFFNYYNTKHYIDEISQIFKKSLNNYL